MDHIAVLLAEDHAIVRQGLRTLLETEKDIKVVGEAKNGRLAVEMAKELRPAIIVMDVAMPLLNGLEATRQILKILPTTKIILLSAHGEDEYIEQALELGVSGYLIKQSSSDVLQKAIREVLKGKQFFSPSIERRFKEQKQKLSDQGGSEIKKRVDLSSREVEVLQLIAESKANKEIADELSISIKTVEKHRQHLMEKLNIHNTAGLTRYAISKGIVESSDKIGY